MLVVCQYISIGPLWSKNRLKCPAVVLHICRVVYAPLLDQLGTLSRLVCESVWILAIEPLETPR